VLEKPSITQQLIEIGAACGETAGILDISYLRTAHQRRQRIIDAVGSAAVDGRSTTQERLYAWLSEIPIQAQANLGAESYAAELFAVLANPEMSTGADHMPNLHSLFWGLGAAGMPLQIAAALLLVAGLFLAARATSDFEAPLALALVTGVLVGFHGYLADGALFLPALFIFSTAGYARVPALVLTVPIPWLLLQCPRPWPVVAQAASSSTSSASTSNSGGITAESIVSTVLESGLGMVPLVVGLLGLFGGGGTPAPTTLEKYAMPERQYFEGADTGSDVSGADYDQMGMPRAYSAAPDGGSAQTSGSASPGSGSGGSGAPSGPSGAGAAQITVNVQAMDSQSFLDHSNEIAQAVRAAMLNSNSINDVVNNL